jgi:ABC-type glycerol-3-phosphate transport system permease component
MAVQELTAPGVRSQAIGNTEIWHPRRGIRWGAIARHVILILFCALVLLPLFWVILMSLKSIPDGVHRYIWPKNFMNPLYGHYQWVWEKRPDVRKTFWNSVMVTVGTVLCATITSVLAGYALVHLRTPGRRFIVGFLVASTFFPTRVTALVGIYNIQSKLGLINVTWGLILPYTALNIAISIFIMRGVFETIPKDIVDSSRIDGASSFRALIGIMLPLVRNGVVVVIIVNFVAAWGEYLLAQTLMFSAGNKTLPVFIANAGGGLGAWFWPRLSALYILAIAPGLIFFAFTQRWYMKGLQEGALKT